MLQQVFCSVALSIVGEAICDVPGLKGVIISLISGQRPPLSSGSETHSFYGGGGSRAVLAVVPQDLKGHQSGIWGNS